ncbi:MAG: ABC transporter ATP-binding protein [Gammaproteobacteria bacterium]|jgi:ABC-2 type transport system ATP-binding protein|nr:ABC transporter ATP-binding protein [Gammaproteobacteria bacterium]
MNSAVAIEINQVSMFFKNEQNPALDNISAQIKNGRVTGLVGPDGAGKTTLIRLITGLLHPTKGKIIVCGQDTTHARNDIFETLSYMPQKFGLYEDLTVIENLELYARLRGIYGQQRKDTFEQMLQFTDLKDFTKRIAGKLSGGMKQKLGLACALLSQPKVLLLDEPSVGVDPISRRELWRMVQELIKEDIAVIWATSYLDEAEKCEEVLLLNEGKLLFDGLPQDLTKKVEGRTYLVSPPESSLRTTLSSMIKQKEVLDGIIQGKNVRIMLKPLTTMNSPFPFVATKPRFEDAFVDILQGKYSRESVLANTMHPKKHKNTIPIEAQNLTKKFGDFVAVQNISFSIKQGEIFGLLGPNGAGKSTTFKMLCGLLQPTEGTALVSGFDLKTASSKARARIGYMAQKFSLYSDLSVKQNLDFFSGVYGLLGNDRKEKIDKMIEIFELKHYLNDNAGGLPLGFKQRLALSCAVMHEPDVLFLDEPTSGVDPLTRREFWTHINGMVLKGVTIMITTHFMDEAEYCDRIALIYRGENIASDTPDGLKKSVQGDDLPDPTLEDAFIALIKAFDKKREMEKVA